jgi:hypothetical protein
MSMSLTEPQVCERQNTVTQRLGGKDLRAAERIVRMTPAEVVSVRHGPRSVIAAEDVAVEGFPDSTSSELIDFLCPTHAGCNRDTEVTRIEWRYLDAAPDLDRTDEKDLPRRERPPGGMQWPS